MKTIMLCLMLISPLLLNLSVAQEKITSVEDVTGKATEVQKELQTLYLKMMSLDKTPKSETSSPQKKLMMQLEDYNRKLSRLFLKMGEDKYYSHDNWKILNASLEKVRGLTSLEAVSSDSDLLSNFRKWLRDAEALGSSSEKFAIRSDSNSQPSQAIITNYGGNSNGNIGLVVEDYSIGLNTPQDRIDFVERLTRIRADENAIFSRGYTTQGGYPRNYPAAYIYDNGSFGNTTNFGRRDTITPFYNNYRQPVRQNTTPQIQIRIK
jgi:hypothetical protein